MGKKDFLHGDLTYKIRGVCFDVHNALGSGFKEQLYHNALCMEFAAIGLGYNSRRKIPIFYKEAKIGIYEPDFIVEDKIIVEIKAVPIMPKNFERQLFYYLKATDYKIGFLVNFGTSKLDIRRRIYDSVRVKT